MKTNEFLRLLTTKHKTISLRPKTLIKKGFYNIYDFQRYAKLVKYIDFKCNFSNNGCKFYSGRSECCCINCAYNIGFLEFINSNYLEIKHIAGKFNIKHGFWRKDKGCILEHKYRSVTCLTYSCTTSFSEAEFELIRILRNGVKGTDLSYRELKQLLIENHEKRRS